MPPGEDESGNVEVRRWGEKPEFDFEPRDHQALGEQLGLIDTARGAKVAQAGFYYWTGKGAQLATALFFWTQQELVKRGFTLFMTPCVAKENTLFGTGYLPFFADQTYQISNENLRVTVGITGNPQTVGMKGQSPDKRRFIASALMLAGTILLALAH